MFVTSDIFDLRKIGVFREFDWSENLLCGVAVLGPRWPGAHLAAQFLVEAARRCDLLSGMQSAGYDRMGEARTRSISPSSMERLARGEPSVATEAVGVNLRGSRPAVGTQNGEVLFGGEASGATRADHGTEDPSQVRVRPSRPLSADFIFPLNERPVEKAAELLRLAVDILSAEYGYYYVRDELCFPGAYAAGVAPALDYSAQADQEAEEIHRWAEFAREGDLWSGRTPLLRDLYEVNLLSARHATEPVEGLGSLAEWISSSPERGRLAEVNGGRLIWTLSDVEMFNVRPLLNRAGLLFSCHDRVYRDLPARQPIELP